MTIVLDGAAQYERGPIRAERAEKESTELCLAARRRIDSERAGTTVRI
jgi:hypothetical protein